MLNINNKNKGYSIVNGNTYLKLLTGPNKYVAHNKAGGNKTNSCLYFRLKIKHKPVNNIAHMGVAIENIFETMGIFLKML